MHAQDSPVRIPLHARDGSIRAYALVDQADAHLAEHPWCLDSRGYAARNVERDDGSGKKTHLLMHRAVLGLTRGDGLQADHINRDRLDNRRSNLRSVTLAQNRQNRTPYGRSQYRGVSWHAQSQKWRAKAKVGDRHYHLGLFDDEHKAGRVAADFRAQHMPYAVS